MKSGQLIEYTWETFFDKLCTKSAGETIPGPFS